MLIILLTGKFGESFFEMPKQSPAADLLRPSFDGSIAKHKGKTEDGWFFSPYCECLPASL